MRFRNLGFLVCVASVSTQLCNAQTPDSSSPKTILCDLLGSSQQEQNGCTHQFVSGELYKTATLGGLAVTVRIEEGSKNMRAMFGISNYGQKAVDVIPSDFVVEVFTPHSRTLHYLSPEKIAKSEEKHAARSNTSRRVLGGLANALSAAGGASQQRSTTQTTSSGTISAHSSDGTYATGTYSGTSTSTTSSPDPAAQERAAEQIRQRNANIAAANARRNAEVAVGNAQLMQSALSANTISPGGTTGGFVYFEGDKKARIVSLRMPIAGTLYEFKFDFE